MVAKPGIYCRLRVDQGRSKRKAQCRGQSWELAAAISRPGQDVFAAEQGIDKKKEDGHAEAIKIGISLC
jgi:hypothetical protein